MGVCAQVPPSLQVSAVHAFPSLQSAALVHLVFGAASPPLELVELLDELVLVDDEELDDVCEPASEEGSTCEE